MLRNFYSKLEVIEGEVMMDNDDDEMQTFIQSKKLKKTTQQEMRKEI